MKNHRTIVFGSIVVAASAYLVAGCGRESHAASQLGTTSVGLVSATKPPAATLPALEQVVAQPVTRDARASGAVVRNTTTRRDPIPEITCYAAPRSRGSLRTTALPPIPRIELPRLPSPQFRVQPIPPEITVGLPATPAEPAVDLASVKRLTANR